MECILVHSWYFEIRVKISSNNIISQYQVRKKKFKIGCTFSFSFFLICTAFYMVKSIINLSFFFTEKKYNLSGALHTCQILIKLRIAFVSLFANDINL